MRYSFEFLEAAAKEVSKLDKAIRERAKQKIDQLCEDPFRYPIGKPLRGAGGLYSSRFADDWRILYLPDESNKKIIITGVKHRSEAYE